MTKEEQYMNDLKAFIHSKDLDKEFIKWQDSRGKGRFTEKPNAEQEYWYVNTLGLVKNESWFGHVLDDWRFKNIPLWKSLEDCQRYLEINDFIHDRARPFEPDLCNYFIIYDYGTDTVGSHESYLTANQLYFDKDDIDEILYKFTAEELKKYYFLIED